MAFILPSAAPAAIIASQKSTKQPNFTGNTSCIFTL